MDFAPTLHGMLSVVGDICMIRASGRTLADATCFFQSGLSSFCSRMDEGKKVKVKLEVFSSFHIMALTKLREMRMSEGEL